jgi:GR25 family glycosyltransferase involved in LPS biosynthesis
MKSYIITLSQIESSRVSAAKVKAKLDEFDMPNELFEGTYGNAACEQYIAEERKWHPWGFKGPNRRYSEEWREQIPPAGEIGCFYSHYRLWQLCVDINESILIFEDDMLLIRPFCPVKWDDVLSVAFSHTKKMPRYQHFLDAPEGDPRAEPYGQASMPGNGGYAIHPHAARKLIEMYTNTYLPADNAINQHVVRIQIHSHMMGRAPSKHDGNISLIRTHAWDELV